MIFVSGSQSIATQHDLTQIEAAQRETGQLEMDWGSPLYAGALKGYKEFDELFAGDVYLPGDLLPLTCKESVANSIAPYFSHVQTSARAKPRFRFQVLDVLDGVTTAPIGASSSGHADWLSANGPCVHRIMVSASQLTLD